MALIVLLFFCMMWLFMALAIGAVIVGNGNAALNFVFAMIGSALAYALLSIAWRG